MIVMSLHRRQHFSARNPGFGVYQVDLKLNSMENQELRVEVYVILKKYLESF